MKKFLSIVPIKIGNILRITSAIFLFINIAHSQYLPMIETGKYWIYVAFQSNDLPNKKGGHLIKIEGDTLIENQLYQKVIQSTVAGTHPCPPDQMPCFEFSIPYEILDNEVVGFARENVDLKQSYYLPLKDDFCSMEEFILFDFSLMEGDSLNECGRQAIGGDSNSSFGLIESTTTASLYNKERRALNTRGFPSYIGLPAEGDIQIAEGLGFTKHGLLHRFNNLSELVDFCEGSLADCQIVSGVNERKAHIDYSLFPNPATSFINIRSTSEISGLNIHTADGNLIWSGTIENGINVQEFPSGLYFFQIEFKHREGVFEKIIKL